MKIPKLVGHRGNMAEYPENTLIGIEAALRAGACLVEFDVQMSGQGELLVIHDSNLDRTSGINLDVFSSGYAEIKKISVHQPDVFLDKFIGTTTALLKDVLDLFSDFNAATAVVEIKKESLEKWGIESVMGELLPELEAHQNNCLLISFDLSALEYTREHSTISIGWVLKYYDDASLNRAKTLNPEVLICNQRKIPQGEAPKKGNWQWMLYDITDPEQALRYADLGVEMIETADISAMLHNHQLKKKGCRNGL
jgi:glycerophosphoryl diester phosphodiesterase